MIRQFELVERVKAYDPSADEDALNRAYVFAMKMHGTQTRLSGDPFFSHPLEVAGILTDYKVDVASIITALLHDTIEDTETTINDVTKLFSKEVAQLVDGVTKLTRIEFQSDQAKQAENFRKFVLAMSEDIRVLLVKLADRLHNMRTLNFIKNIDKRRRIALETMDIYAPLAERIGMHGMKNELEDLAFRELNPDARKSIIKRLDFLRQKGGDLVSRIITELEKTLSNSDIKATIEGREKTPYSVWDKMQKQDVGFEQLSDIMAFRVVLGSVEDCYRALGVIHGAYPVVPGRFKDYISTAKPNGYQSLHTGVFGPERQRIEMQIRTAKMHDVAKHGVAAHWNYKQSYSSKTAPQYRWLRELLDILEHADEPEEFLEHTKLEMFKDQVFCFTPRGDLINLPRGATPVDFAYAVHSEVGDKCVGAKINGRMMPLRSDLRNGDQVEILISKAQTPSPTWESFAITGKARARVRRFIRLKERGEYIKLGQAILDRAFTEVGHKYSKKAVTEVAKVFHQQSVDDLCAEVGAGNYTGRDIVEAVFPGSNKKRKQSQTMYKTQASTQPTTALGEIEKKSHLGVSIKGLIPGMAMHIANCCHPLPGDRIVGIVTTGKGITVHTIDCEMLEDFADESERWLDIFWEAKRETVNVHVGRILLTVLNIPGSLGELSMVIANNDGNISNLKITNRSIQFFEMTIDIEVRDVKHLTAVIAALRADPAINSVKRARG
jgi:GTP pyrophosphokinase